MKPKTRRDFIKKTFFLASLFPFAAFPLDFTPQTGRNERLSVHIFSKHLQFLDYQSTGEAAAEMGFDGVDLTVRPKGHVLPIGVETGLPKAIEAIRKGGSQCKMITTNVKNVDNPEDVSVLQTAAKLGTRYYRLGWYEFLQGQTMEDSLAIYQTQIKDLGDLNKELGIIGCYQNHAGKKVGASFWEINEILRTVNKAFLGTQYDIRHAVAEGGYSWENGLQLLLPTIKTIVLKDFKWGKVRGSWKALHTPIGEGMVNFDKYFKFLKEHQLHPPVSLHLEYDLGGAEKGLSKIEVDQKVVFDKMKKDLNKIHELWEKA